MPMVVVCPNCRKSFRVNERFAGKSGPCPQCKATIKVPEKVEEVKVHTPEQFGAGGRSTTGKLLLKPIARKQVKLDPVVAVSLGAATLVVLLATWALGNAIQGNLVVRAIGLLLVSPPLVVAAYSILRDDELEPYRGISLYIRAAICGTAYTILWGVYGYVSGMALSGQLWEWVFVAPPFLVSGALMALACLDLDFGSGVFHYAFYVLVSMLLRWAAGMGWIWNAS